jgi:beta-glucuronidase
VGRSSAIPVVSLLLVCAALAAGEQRRVYPQNQRVVSTSADVTVTVWIRNTLDNTTNVNAEFLVLDGAKVVASGTESATIAPESVAAIVSTIHVPQARLWSLDRPNLYELKTVVTKNAEAVEGAYDTEIRSVFGIREVEVRGTELLLNGEAIRLAGLSGSGLDDDGLRLMKEAGLGFLWVGSGEAHLLDWADRNGLLIIVEGASVEREWNHPSVIGWSVGERITVACGADCSADFLRFEMDGPVEALGKRLDVVHAKYPDKAVFVVLGAPLPNGHGSDLGVTGAKLGGTGAKLGGAGANLGGSTGAGGGDEYFSAMAKVFRQHSFVVGAAVATVDELRTAYTALRREFSPIVISSVGQVDGVTQISLLNRGDFPAVVVRGYEIRVGNQTQPIPDLKPGDSIRLDFHSVNPYRVEIVTPTGFVVADR